MIIVVSLLVVWKTNSQERREELNKKLNQQEKLTLECINQSNQHMDEFKYVTVKLKETEIEVDCPRLVRIQEEYDVLSDRCQEILKDYEILVQESREVYAKGEADLSTQRAIKAQENFLANREFIDDKVTKCLQKSL
ncbi:hypothetical protein ACFLRC_01060 [Candidatus Altiarchaeota archaeon]